MLDALHGDSPIACYPNHPILDVLHDLHGESLSPFPDELPDGLDLVIHHFIG
jgi:hypothetical protein